MPFWEFVLREDGWLFAIHPHVPRIVVAAPPDGYVEGLKQNAFLGQCLKKATYAED